MVHIIRHRVVIARPVHLHRLPIDLPFMVVLFTTDILCFPLTLVPYHRHPISLPYHIESFFFLRLYHRHSFLHVTAILYPPIFHFLFYHWYHTILYGFCFWRLYHRHSILHFTTISYHRQSIWHVPTMPPMCLFPMKHAVLPPTSAFTNIFWRTNTWYDVTPYVHRLGLVGRSSWLKLCDITSRWPR